jgi:hypothetical protein
MQRTRCQRKTHKANYSDERLYPQRKRLKFYQARRSQKARRKFKEFKFKSELPL